jgi:hypothetical protein
MPAASIWEGVGDRVRGGFSTAVDVAMMSVAQRQHWTREPAVSGIYIRKRRDEGCCEVEPGQLNGWMDEMREESALQWGGEDQSSFNGGRNGGEFN